MPKINLDERIKLILPAGLVELKESRGALHNGRKTFRIECVAAASIPGGVIAVKFDARKLTPPATWNDEPYTGSCETEKWVEFIEKRKVASKKDKQTANENISAPTPRFILVEGSKDEQYGGGFGGSIENQTDFFNYRVANHMIHIYLNTAFPKWTATRDGLMRAYRSPALEADVLMRFEQALALNGMLQADGSIGLGGAMDETHYAQLERLAMGILTTVVSMYHDANMRRVIEQTTRIGQLADAAD